jgi:peptidoglycan hydrolase-like protein with peptidoglycan-binding domain
MNCHTQSLFFLRSRFAQTSLVSLLMATAIALPSLAQSNPPVPPPPASSTYSNDDAPRSTNRQRARATDETRSSRRASNSLRRNDSGEEVAELQRQLSELGYYDDDITGFFGPVTRSAVVRFQRDNELEADGIVGAETRTAIRQELGEAEPVADNTGSDTDASTNTDANTARVREVLRRGDRGAQVSELQRRLTELGYYDGRVSGVFGSQTETAVMDFQEDNDIEPDGVVGPETASALREAPDQAQRPDPDSERTNRRSLRMGDRGAEVVELQRQLRELGYYEGPITGNYGSQTEAAVIRFQEIQGLETDGIAGPQVLAALGGAG